MNDDISTSLDDWFRPMTATEILEREGHTIKGDRCPKCWEEAEERALKVGGHPAMYYGDIVYENQKRAIKEVENAK